MFSRFDTIHLLLSLEYPDIPVEQRRNVAIALLPVCKDTFASYPLEDDYASRPEFRQLKEELRHTLRCWIDENGLPGCRSPAPSVPLRAPYTKHPKSRKRNKRH